MIQLSCSWTTDCAALGVPPHPHIFYNLLFTFEELVAPAVSALRRAIAEAKQLWSVIGWVTKNLLSRAPLCFGRHVKPAAFAVVSMHQPTLDPRGI
jgi:hypothetical protein